MRQLLVFAGIVAALGIYVARQADKVASIQAPSAMVAARDSTASTSAGAIELTPDRQGHFHADGRVDGRRLEFLVDTGSTTVALTARSAGELGIHPAAREFSTQAHTANGVVAVAPVRLGMVEVGDVVVHDVMALVFPDGVLGENLLGMSFLSRLRRYEYANGKLVLEQ